MTNEEVKQALLTCRPVEWRGGLDYLRVDGYVKNVIYSLDKDSPNGIKVSATIVDHSGSELVCPIGDLHFLQGGTSDG